MFKWINDYGCGIEFERILFQKGYLTFKDVKEILKLDKGDEMTTNVDLSNEVLNLDCKDFINWIDEEIKRIAKNPKTQFNQVLELMDMKYRYMKKFVVTYEKFKKLYKVEQFLLYQYVLQNKNSKEVANLMRISERTFFRYLEEIRGKWFNE